jgi:hypothetical protein
MKVSPFLAVIPALLVTSSSHAYTSYKSSEAVLNYDAFLDIPFEVKKGKVVKRWPTHKKVLDLIVGTDEVAGQVQYMFGPMIINAAMDEIQKDFLNRKYSAPKGDEVITNIEVEEREDGYRAYYHYKGTIVVQNGPKKYYNIALPRNPADLYARSLLKSGKNPCTDPKYPSFDDFWYFWSPDWDGCKERITPYNASSEEGDYLVIRADMQRLPNVASSRPEYENLVQDGGEIKVSLLMGMDDPKNMMNPILSAKKENKKRDDLNAQNFRGLKKEFEDAGFVAKPWSRERIAALVPYKITRYPYAEDLVYEGYDGERATKMTVTMFFGQTGSDQKHSTPFHFFFRDALMHSSVLIYDGHSGLGSNLFLPWLKRFYEIGFNPSKKQYQIYYFNACSSYAYYNNLFFDRKKTESDPTGTKMLDIITSAAEASFGSGVQTNFSLINSVHKWAKTGRATSYQALMKRLEDDNLAGVNGDEDNPEASE